ncbi:MAG: V-type ATP synthase subunit E [Spirochaetes bacterium]|nr:V-type ATP synthase subunit E [Spirochaetota bacterium]
MGFTDIINKIENDGKLKLEQIEKEWDQKIKQQKEKIDKEIEIYVKEQIERLEKDIENDERKRFLDFKLECRNKILEKKRSLIDKVFNEVFNKYLSYDRDIYIQFLESLVKKSVKDRGYQIILNKRDRDELGDKLINKLGDGFTLSSDTVNIKAGLILKKGNIEINLSFDQIFKLKKEKLEQEVGKILNVI